MKKWSLLLKSRKQFLWYLKLDNFKLMLLLFPVLVFFSVFLLFPFSFPPSSPPRHSPDFYCWDPARWCKMVGISFCVASSSINVLNNTKLFTIRVLTDSLPPLFQFASSSLFVFYILFSLFNIIFRM